MRANVSPVGAFKKEPPCGSHGYWIGSGGNSVSITLECGRWDCPECGVKRTNQWFALIDEYLPGSVLYVAEKQREEQRIQNIVNGCIYYCVHTLMRPLYSVIKGSRVLNRGIGVNSSRNQENDGDREGEKC